MNNLPDACPYCDTQLENQESDESSGLFFEGLFCPECDYQIPSFDFPMYSNDL